MKRSTKLMLTMAVVAICVFPAAVSFADTTSWNIAGDFSEADNANGAWDYGYYGSSGYTRLTQRVSTSETWAQTQGFIGWVPAIGYSDPGVIKNVSGVAQTHPAAAITWQPAVLSLDPYGSAITVVRWTAPAAGTYNINATFTQLQGTVEQGAEIYIKDVKVFADMLTGTGDSGTYSNSNQVLAAGDMVIFGAPGNGNAMVTALGGTITLVPEPGTITLLCMGLLGLLAYAWRKRR